LTTKATHSALAGRFASQTAAGARTDKAAIAALPGVTAITPETGTTRTTYSALTFARRHGEGNRIPNIAGCAHPDIADSSTDTADTIATLAAGAIRSTAGAAHAAGLPEYRGITACAAGATVTPRAIAASAAIATRPRSGCQRESGGREDVSGHIDRHRTNIAGQALTGDGARPAGSHGGAASPSCAAGIAVRSRSAIAGHAAKAIAAGPAIATCRSTGGECDAEGIVDILVQDDVERADIAARA
jgi:hypothetical protein